jgi:hypothetical protein
LRNLSLLSKEHNRHAETHHETNNVTEQLRRFDRTMADETHHETNNVTEQLRHFNRTMADASLEPFVEIPLNRDAAFQIPKKQSDLVYNSEQSVGSRKQNDSVCNAGRDEGSKLKTNRNSETNLEMSVTSRQNQKLAMAQWKLAQLEAMQLLLDEQHKLETEMREKEFKTEMARLQMKK